MHPSNTITLMVVIAAASIAAAPIDQSTTATTEQADSFHVTKQSLSETKQSIQEAMANSESGFKITSDHDHSEDNGPTAGGTITLAERSATEPGLRRSRFDVDVPVIHMARHEKRSPAPRRYNLNNCIIS